MSQLIHNLAEIKVTDNVAVYSKPFFVGQDIIACLVSLQPGAIVPLHVHQHHGEIFDVIEGEGIFRLGEQEILLKPGMTVCVPANTYHGLEAKHGHWVLRETVHQHVYARQAIKRALQKRWSRLWQWVADSYD